MSVSTELLEIRGLRKAFVAPDGSTHRIIDMPEFTMKPAEQLALAGESGSGKTTLLNLIASILKPDAGSIKIDGREMSALNESKRDRLRATVAVVATAS